MFDDLVLGIDPGTARIGLALVSGPPSRPRVLWSETFRTPSAQPVAERLVAIHDRVRAVLQEHRPGMVALERLMWGQNTGSAMEVSRASGAIMVAAGQAGVGVEEYAPLEVKMAITGVGNAPKEQVRRSLTRILRIEGVPHEPDAADAVAVAVCHIQQSRLKLARAAGAR